MEKMLLKLARQLDSLDEASLMALWSKYATMTSRFEPTKRWEEACLVFSLIQAKHWKNQLFNYSLAQHRLPPLKSVETSAPLVPEFGLEKPDGPSPEDRQSCRVLSFSDGQTKSEKSPKPEN